MQCVVCKTALNNGIDTFGDVGLEMCWGCYSGLFEDAAPTRYVTLMTISADKPPFITIGQELEFEFDEEE